MATPSNSLSFLEANFHHRRHRSAAAGNGNGGAGTPPLSLTLPSSSFLPSFPFLSLHKCNHHHHHSPIRSLPSPSSPHPPPSNELVHGGAFLGPDDLANLRVLDGFRYVCELPGGSVEIRPMASEEVGPTVNLLAESFAEVTWKPGRYVRFLEYLVRQYVLQKRAVIPHAVMLVVLYKEKWGHEVEFAGTAEVSFDAVGTNEVTPTPVPPRDSPYICNMTVKAALRRKGIGRHLLKACEELIWKMSSRKEVYLHCRVIDKVPLRMYKKAGYHIVKTDNISVWLKFQRRKHLMCKKLSASNIQDTSHPSK